MRIYLLLLFVLMVTRTQATNVIFDRITMDSGLSSSSVTSILKDRTGYVWVGTTEGLNRYDGYTFKVFLPVPDCPESIQSSSIDKLFEDSDGGIWIFFSSGGISRYDRGSDTFLNFTKEWLRQQLRVYGSPTCFSASVPGHIFIGTENGMLEYDAKEKKLVRLSSAGSVVSSSPVNCLYSAPDHSFWVGTLAGFSLYDKETNHFQDYTIRTNDREDINAGNLNGVNAIYIDRFDYMWLGTGREGAFRSVDMGEREIFQSVGREDTRVYQFLETGDGDFWIGHNKGTSLISRMNRLALRCEHFFDRPEDLEPTGECQVRSIFESKDGTVWFDDSRFNQGLFYYSPKERKMGQLRNVPEDAHSISSNQITCLFLDDSDHLWAGHSTYGVSHADLTPSLFRYTLGYTEKENLSSLHILAVYEDSDLNLWVATSRGLDRINHKTSRVDMRFTFSPQKSPSSLSGKIIGSIREDSERNLWISYQDANPDRLNLDDFRIRPFIPDYQVSYDYPINSLSELCNLCVSEESWFWGGADEGRLRVWDTKTRALITYRYIPGEMNPLASNHIHCLFVDSSGYLWIGTNAGLDQYDKRTGRFDHFTVQDGLSGNIVRGIREGEPGILFVSTNKGLSRLDIQNRHIVNYTTANGLLSNEFMGGACCKRKSGELVFGSNEGIVSFDPVQLTDGLRKIPESLRITNLTIGDSREKQGLQVGFIAFDYSHPRSIRYRYRLDGYDTDWREVDASDRTAIYNRLPPGNYVFRVETSGNGSYWSAPITEPVRIFPPWWRTWWFILLVFVVVCVLLCIAYKSRVRWYQLRQAELERKIQERTRLLKQAKQELEEKDALKTRFFMNVSHELRTPLTIIKGLTEDLERHSGSEESCGDKETLRTISRNTNRLIRHVNELLDLSVLTRGVPSPHIVCADLSRFLKEISETFIPLADSYKIAFTYSIAPDISIAYFDKNILEQVLYNLLSNAFKYTPDGGSVSFSALLEQSSSDAVMTLRITDSGIGIPPESLPYIFDQYYKGESIAFRRSESSGIGLAYTKELLELHKATIQCESELGKGSVFTVALPISEEAYPEEWLEYSEPKMEEASLRESVPLEGTNPVPENLRQTLLFVEDNEDLCRYLMNAFQTDYRVVIAKNGKVGLEKAMEILPDVIVSDVMMPVMNGIECCEALKTDERTAHIPVILLTALAEERQQLEGYGAGADDYLPKPFSLAVLKAKIKNLLKRSERLKLYFRDRFDLRTPEQTVANPDKEFVSKVTRVVLAHLQDPEFDVELFCSEMAMSRASLFRKLKSTTGCSASNYFTRCFKEIYGITPSEFIQTSPSSQDSHSPLASSGK